MTIRTLLALLVTVNLGAQTDTTWSFADFQTVITQKQLSITMDANDTDTLNSISDSLDRLRTRYIQAYGQSSDTAESILRNVAPEYSQSMAADIAALNSLPSDAEKRKRILKEIRADLKLKVKFVSSLGATGTFPSVVRVTVDTVNKDGEKVSGLWVRCNPQRYGVTANPLFVFNSATTPTARMLPPGLFILWVESSDKKVLASQPIEVGADGQDNETLSFSLP